MNLIHVIDDVFHQIRFYLSRLEQEKYQRPLEIFSGSSIGQHTRHIIEFFQCLLAQIDSGTLNYDLRQRNRKLEQSPEYAMAEIVLILDRLRYLNQLPMIQLVSSYGAADEQEPLVVDTSLERELLYNIEHAIHHLAMIKIGLKIVAPDMKLLNSFGVANATLAFQQKTLTT